MKKHPKYNMSTLDTEVKKQALLLAKEIKNLALSANGKFVAFYDGAYVVEESHEACFNKAVSIFGNKGFAISEVAPEKELVVSSLVKY